MNVNRVIRKKLTYHWFREGSDGAEKRAGKNIIKISPLNMNNAGRYHCVVSYDDLEIKSNPLTVEVRGELSAEMFM